MLRKLLEPNLGKVPKRSCRIFSASSGEIGVLTRVSTDIETIVLSRDRGILEVYDLQLTCVQVGGNVHQAVVAKTDLYGLVEI